MEPRLHDELQRRQARRHRERVSRQRAGLIHRPQGCELFHDLASAAERAERQAAADHLAERRQVRPDAVMRLGAAERDAKSGHHLIEYEQRAMARAVLAQRFEKARRRQNEVHVAGHRLDDHGGDLRSLARERRVERFEIVVAQHQGMRRGFLGYAGRARVAEGERAGAGLDEQRVGVTVITTLEFDDDLAPGEAAREANRCHRRLRA